MEKQDQNPTNEEREDIEDILLKNILNNTGYLGVRIPTGHIERARVGKLNQDYTLNK